MRKGSTRRPQDDSPAVHVKNYITPGGLERLKAEHQFLLTKDRPAVAEVVAWAASNGDRSENVGCPVHARCLSMNGISGVARMMESPGTLIPFMTMEPS
jgi:hypothetical protein